jgi:plastocyanin
MRATSWSLLPAALLPIIADAANHVVSVGKSSQLKFDPETLAANVGDTITYQFFAKVSLIYTIQTWQGMLT